MFDKHNYCMQAMQVCQKPNGLGLIFSHSPLALSRAVTSGLVRPVKVVNICM